MYFEEILGTVYLVGGIIVAVIYLVRLRRHLERNPMRSFGLVFLAGGLIGAFLTPISLFIVLAGIIFIILGHNPPVSSDSYSPLPMNRSSGRSSGKSKITKKTFGVVCSIAILVFATSIYFDYAYQHNLLDTRPGIDCPQLTPDNLGCQAFYLTWGRIISVQSNSVPGWFLGLGDQPKETIGIFVLADGANFTTSFLGCDSSVFHIGENLSVIIAAYNATYQYNGYSEFTNMPDSQVTNSSLDRTTTITFGSTSSIVLDEIVRFYIVPEVPSGCEQA